MCCFFVFIFSLLSNRRLVYMMIWSESHTWARIPYDSFVCVQPGLLIKIEIAISYVYNHVRECWIVSIGSCLATNWFLCVLATDHRTIFVCSFICLWRLVLFFFLLFDSWVYLYNLLMLNSEFDCPGFFFFSSFSLFALRLQIY